MANWYEGSFNFPAGSCGIALTGKDFDVGTLYHYSFTVASSDPGTPYAGSFGIQKICSSPLGAAPAAGILKHSPDGGIGAHSGSGSFVAGGNAAGSDLHYAVATMAMAPGSTGTCTFVINPDGWVGGDPPPPPSGPPGPPVFEVVGPDLVALGTLEDVNKWRYRWELKDVGSGMLQISRYSADATEEVLTQGNWCLVTVPRISPDPIGIWQLETGQTVLADSREEVEENVTWGGRGGLSLLDRIVAWNESFVVPAGKSQSGTYVGPASTGVKAGQILKRAIDEWTHEDRGVSDFGVRTPVLDQMTHDFDYTDDSDGNPWETTPSTAELGIGHVGESGLVGIAKLLGTGGIDILMVPGDGTLDLHAYNYYGRDLTGSDFGEGVVRFVRGVNVAERLHRQVGVELAPTHMLIGGDLPAWGYARAPDYLTRPTKEGFLQTQGSDPDVLEQLGLAEIRRLLRSGQSISLVVDVPLVEDPLVGDYLPGPPGTNGHYWLGDTVTLHADADAYGDMLDEDVRIMAVVLEPDDAGDIRCTVEVQWTQLTGRSPMVIGSGGGMSTGGGTAGGITPAPTPAAGTLHSHDHGALAGLGDNDHPQYTTDAEVNALIAGALSDDVPLVESGSGSAGTSGEASRSDHVHPDDGGGGGGGGSASADAVYGSGFDGNVTISAPTSLTRDMYYDVLTLNDVLNPAGHRIFAKRITGTGVIRINGNNGGNGGNGTAAAGGTAGGAGATGPGNLLPAGSTGQAGKVGGFNANGVAGGTGNASQTGTVWPTSAAGGSAPGRTGGAGATNGSGVGLSEKPFVYPQMVYFKTFNNAIYNMNQIHGSSPSAGSGAGNPSSGGGGSGGSGSGGGVVVCVAKQWDGSWSIESKGGNGGNGGNGGGTDAGGGGGGSGGSGGTVIGIFADRSGWTGSIDVSAGTGGAAGAGIGAGTAGGAGAAGAPGHKVELQMG